MASKHNLDALFADAELPSGTRGGTFDDTPTYLEDFVDHYEPPPMDPPEEGIVHYVPGDRSLCGTESALAVYTDDPYHVVGCDDCLELVQEYLHDHNEYRGRCLHCHQESWHRKASLGDA